MESKHLLYRLQAINNLKRREDIIITKPDKGSGVVVMDKTDYLRLLCDTSIRDSTKFIECSNERPKPVENHPSAIVLCWKRRMNFYTKVHNILPKSIADSLCPKGSRLAHLYGLPKTHKPDLSMRPVLSATNTYNYPLTKWLEEKLKPLSTTAYTISESFNSLKISETSLLMLTTYSYHASKQPCLPMFLPTKPLEYLLKKLLLKTGLITSTIKTSPKTNLWNCSSLQLQTSSFNLMVYFTNKWRALPWALHLGHY